MGRPKAFLRQELTGATFLAHLAGEAAAAGLTPIVVVGRVGDVQLERAAEAAGARFVPNPRAPEGQLSSVLMGLATLESAVAGVVLMPVDVPFVTAAVIRALVAAAEEPGVAIARATDRGRHGHPVLFTRAVFDELRRADPSTGARAVVRADPARVRDVEVGEAGVTIDIDTPEDYLRAFGRRL